MEMKQTVEFRQKVVSVSQTNGLSRKQGASDLDIDFSRLSRWIKEKRSRRLHLTFVVMHHKFSSSQCAQMINASLQQSACRSWDSEH